MTDRPIIFSGPMVRALLAGRKTMTRRLATSPLAKVKAGDRLWVREGCADQHPLAIQEGRYSQPGRAGIPGPPPVHYRTIYRVDGEPLQIWRNGGHGYPYFTRGGPSCERDAKYPTVTSNFGRGSGNGIYWAPSIHMPRWASRLTLIVEAARIDRLQEISEADAMAEGVAHWTAEQEGHGAPPDVALVRVIYGSCRAGFVHLWESLHGAGSWEANPEIVAVTFRVERRNIDEAMEASDGAAG